MSNNEIIQNNTKCKCQCCNRNIFNTESIYTINISKDFSPEIILDSVCVDCYNKFVQIINNAKIWMKTNA